MSVIINPIEQYFDLNGNPLENGYLYFGEVFGNPITQPVMVYFDPEFTIPAAQPVRTVNGYPVRSGTATGLFSPQDVSILIQNNKKEQILYVESSNINVSQNTTFYRDSDTTLNADDNNKTFVFLSSFTQTFDAAVNLGDRWRVDLINMSNGNINLDPNLSETIDGQASLQLQPNSMLTVYCDGVNLETTTNVYPVANIATAASLDLRTVKPKVIKLTGSATVNAIQMVNGDKFTASITGTPTFVNSANLVVEGKRNYTAAADDIVTITSDGTVTMVSITRASGNPAANIFPSGHINGLRMSTAGASATMSIAAGVAADSTNSILMSLSAISKTTAAWAVGNNQGGLDTGVIANNTWYYFFEISRQDTGVTDVIFSTNPALPALPANYTYNRYFGAGLTNGSAQWTSFTQFGDDFYLSTPIADFNGAGSTTAALLTATVPRGRKVKAYFNVTTISGGQATYLSDPANADLAVSASVAPGFSAGGLAAANNGGQAACWTNTSAQVRHREFNTNTLQIVTIGWMDLRGKEV